MLQAISASLRPRVAALSVRSYTSSSLASNAMAAAATAHTELPEPIPRRKYKSSFKRCAVFLVICVCSFHPSRTLRYFSSELMVPFRFVPRIAVKQGVIGDGGAGGGGSRGDEGPHREVSQV